MLTDLSLQVHDMQSSPPKRRDSFERVSYNYGNDIDRVKDDTNDSGTIDISTLENGKYSCNHKCKDKSK